LIELFLFITDRSGSEGPERKEIVRECSQVHAVQDGRATGQGEGRRGETQKTASAEIRK